MQTINLNIIPGEVYPIVQCSQGDVGRQFKIKLYDGDSSYSVPSGATLMIIGKKQDDNIFEYSTGLSTSGNEVTVTLQEQMTTTEGFVTCELKILSGSNILGTANFFLKVEGGILDGSESESALDIVTQVINASSTATQDAQSAAQSASAAAQSESNASTSETNAAASATLAAQNAIGTMKTATFSSSSINATTHLVNVTVSGVKSTTQQEILPLVANTAENRAYNQAFQEAEIYDAGQSTNKITLYVTNIPVVATTYKFRVIIRGT